MKYIEFGIGNTWLVRTEFEETDKEYECQGIVGPLIPVGYYFRLWIGKSVFIISTNEGFKQTKKNTTPLNSFSASNPN